MEVVEISVILSTNYTLMNRCVPFLVLLQITVVCECVTAVGTFKWMDRYMRLFKVFSQISSIFEENRLYAKAAFERRLDSVAVKQKF